LITGEIRAFVNSGNVKSGWLACDGTTFNQSVYPNLYTALGNSNTLPNLTDNRFLKGSSTARVS